jgi:hypothetical protein
MTQNFLREALGGSRSPGDTPDTERPQLSISKTSNVRLMVKRPRISGGVKKIDQSDLRNNFRRVLLSLGQRALAEINR